MPEINCREIAQSIKDRVKNEIAELGVNLALAVVVVGNDPASEIYVRNKEKVCEYVGIKSVVVRLPETTQQEELEFVVKNLNSNSMFTGIMIQLPLPKHLNPTPVIECIDYFKDVDGLTLYNQGLLAAGRLEACLVPCTPKGVLTMIDSIGYELEGKHVAIFGRSELFGKPMLRLCLNRNATVSMCHSRSTGHDRRALLQLCDVVIVAVGKPNEISLNPYYITDLLIDVGINRTEDGIVGDVDKSSLPNKTLYTPVPGGVGLLTTATLAENTLQAYKLQKELF